MEYIKWRKENPILLIVNGYTSHKYLKVLQKKIRKFGNINLKPKSN